MQQLIRQQLWLAALTVTVLAGGCKQAAREGLVLFEKGAASRVVSQEIAEREGSSITRSLIQAGRRAEAAEVEEAAVSGLAAKAAANYQRIAKQRILSANAELRAYAQQSQAAGRGGILDLSEAAQRIGSKFSVEITVNGNRITFSSEVGGYMAFGGSVLVAGKVGTVVWQSSSDERH